MGGEGGGLFLFKKMVSAPYMFTGDNVGDAGLVKRIGVGTVANDNIWYHINDNNMSCLIMMARELGMEGNIETLTVEETVYLLKLLLNSIVQVLGL